MPKRKGFGSIKKIEKATLERMKRAGMTEFAIAEKLGCHRSHVTRATIVYGLQGMGAKRGHGPIKVAAISKRELGSLRNKGWKLQEIAEHFGCGIDHITVLIRRYGLPKSKAGRPVAPTTKAAR
jgi:hypothetical protein